MLPNDSIAPTLPGTEVLNPFLFGRLQQRFGTVIVAKQGCASLGSYVPSGAGVKYQFIDAGEYYRVNCPFCPQRGAADLRQRLWIHHRWGVGLDNGDPDRVAHDKFWWAAVCYNEGCLERQENVRMLRNWIYGLGRDRAVSHVQVLPGKPAAKLSQARMPGRCRRVDELPSYHEACQYLLGRGIDPVYVGKEFGITFCEEADPQYSHAFGKLVTPIYMRGELVGWQARPTFDTDWATTGISKYYNCPGMRKQLVLYNFDNAVSNPWCVVVEGITDVWALGNVAVGLLGKSLAAEQAKLLAQNWQTAVVAVDPDVSERERNRMKATLSANMQAIYVTLPAGEDPATIDKDRFWDLVFAEAHKAGLDLQL